MKITKKQLKEMIREELQPLNERKTSIGLKHSKWFKPRIDVYSTYYEDWDKIQIQVQGTLGNTFVIDVPPTTKEADIQAAFTKAAMAWEKVIQKELGPIKPFK